MAPGCPMQSRDQVAGAASLTRSRGSGTNSARLTDDALRPRDAEAAVALPFGVWLRAG